MVGISAYGALDADIRGRGLSDTRVPPAVAQIQLKEMGEMGVVWVSWQRWHIAALRHPLLLPRAPHPHTELGGLPACARSVPSS